MSVGCQITDDCGHALHLGHHCTDYIMTTLVWWSRTRLARCGCL